MTDRSRQEGTPPVAEGPQDGTSSPPRSGSTKRPTRIPWSSTSPGADVAAATAMLAGVILAAYGLDGPWEHDEMTTVWAYASQSLSVAASKYDSPNNHLLHTLLVWVAHQFGGWNRIALRLPAFLSFCLLLPATWWFVRREHGPTAAAFATALTGTSSYMLMHATTARGYTLMMLMFATTLLCASGLVRRPERKTLWAIWTLAVALGFFTVPLMVLCVATTLAWMLLERWNRCGREALAPFLGRTAACTAVALIVAGVLHLPMLLTNNVAHGVARVVANQEMGPLVGTGTPAERPLPSYLAEVWRSWHLPVPAWAQGALLALIVVGGVVAVRRPPPPPSSPTPAHGTPRRHSVVAVSLPVVAGLLATGLMVLSVRLAPRMLTWLLWALLVAAGIGATFVLDRFLALSAARGQDAVSGRTRHALEFAAPALVLAVSCWWPLQIDSYQYMKAPFAGLALPLVLTESVGKQMEPGDYFTLCEQTDVRRDQRYVVYMNAFHPVDTDVAAYSESDDEEAVAVTTRRAVHRLWSDPASPGKASPSRLFLLEPLAGYRRRCRQEGPPHWEVLEARWPNHEMVAARRDGRVYMLHDWTEAP